MPVEPTPVVPVDPFAGWEKLEDSVEHDNEVTKEDIGKWLGGVCAKHTWTESANGRVFVDFVGLHTGMTGNFDDEDLFNHLNTKYGISFDEFKAIKANCFDDVSAPVEPVQPVVSVAGWEKLEDSVEHDNEVTKKDIGKWLGGVCAKHTLIYSADRDDFVEFVGSHTGMTGYFDEEALFNNLNTKYGISFDEFKAIKANCFDDIPLPVEPVPAGPVVPVPAGWEKLEDSVKHDNEVNINEFSHWLLNFCSANTLTVLANGK